MEAQKILVPVDFSDITPTVIQSALALAEITQQEMMLLHIKHMKSDPDVEQKLISLAAEINDSGKVKCGYVLRTGSIFNEIADEANNPCYSIAIIGTHGFKGFREVMLGADILRLLKPMPIPTLTIQKGYVFPVKGFKNILFPIASHSTFRVIVETTILLAQRFNATIHLYSVEKPELKWTQQLTANISLAETAFEKAGVKYIRVNEPQAGFSLGYSRQTLRYAEAIHADLIALMSVPAKEHFYFADGDKEQLITNKGLIPVISTSSEVRVQI